MQPELRASFCATRPAWPWMLRFWALGLLAPLSLGVGASCASAPKPTPASAPVASPDKTPASAGVPAACDPARDRAAILGMVGTFQVSFTFEETEALSPGYTPADPYRADAVEVVSTLENSERRVVLQHVLLIQKHSGEYQAQKHWRQDWSFEDTTLLEFQGRRVWQERVLSPNEVHCTWSQAVFEVDDGPRYESFGHFVHAGDGASARSVWTSAVTYRPLPRREYTHRHDYDVLLGTNRHAITAQGWEHEQDNVKLVLADNRRLVRERGFNTYRRIDLAQAALAQRYIDQTGSFWADVRAEWQALLARSPRVLVHQELSGKPLYERLFPLATVTPVPSRADIHAVISSYVESAPPSAATASSLRARRR